MTGNVAGGAGPVYLHASAVAVGEAGLLIRGASGSGKSALADALIGHAQTRGCFAQLIGDDRVAVRQAGGRVILSGHPAIAGRIERRGIGIASLPVLGTAVLRLVVDLLPAAPPRLPGPEAGAAEIAGNLVPRLAFRARTDLAIMLPLIMRQLAPDCGRL